MVSYKYWPMRCRNRLVAFEAHRILPEEKILLHGTSRAASQNDLLSNSASPRSSGNTVVARSLQCFQPKNFGFLKINAIMMGTVLYRSTEPEPVASNRGSSVCNTQSQLRVYKMMWVSSVKAWRNMARDRFWIVVLIEQQLYVPPVRSYGQFHSFTILHGIHFDKFPF